LRYQRRSGKPDTGPIAGDNAKVIAVDPGITTGVAFKDYTTGHIVTFATTAPDKLYELISGVDIVVIEDFTTAGRISRPGLDTVQIIGGIKALCWYLGKPYSIQMPAIRRPYVEQAALTLQKLYQHSSDHGTVAVHEIDALAHLLAWERRRCKV